MQPCEDCTEIKKIGFQLKHIELDNEKLSIEIDGLRQEQINRDIEHETISRGLAGRMDSMEEKFETLQLKVTTDVQSIKNDIPALFDAAVNRLLAQILKWLLGGLGILLVLVFLIVGLAFLRPTITQGLQELTNKMQILTEKSKTIEVYDVLDK